MGRGMNHIEPGMLAEDACPNWPYKESETEPRNLALRPAIAAYKAGRLPELDERFTSLMRHLAQASAWTAADSCEPSFLVISFGGGTDSKRILGTMGDLGCGGPDLECHRMGLGLKLAHVLNNATPAC